MTTGKSSAGRLVELDALRGFGAIAVVLFHLTTRFHEIFPRADHVPFRFWAGEYRVFLFFAISGFAIFFSLDRLSHAADFLVNRFSRLFPAYWVAICLTVAVEHMGGVRALQVSAADVAVNATMLQSYFYIPAVDGAYWTLAYELGFYAAMLGLWLLFGFRRLEPLLLVWLGLKWLLFAWPDMPSRLSLLFVMPFVPFFAIGMLYYRIWAGHRPWPRQLPYFAVALLTLLATDGLDLFVAGCCLVAIFGLALGGYLRWLCVRPLLWLGNISYSLYLVHQHIGFVIMLRAHDAGLNHWAGLALALATVVSLGWLLNRWVEKPAQRVIAQWWKARRDGRTIGVAASIGG